MPKTHRMNGRSYYRLTHGSHNELLDRAFDRCRVPEIEIGMIRRELDQRRAREFDWNDLDRLFEGGPRAARDVRASRFADC